MIKVLCIYINTNHSSGKPQTVMVHNITVMVHNITVMVHNITVMVHNITVMVHNITVMVHNITNHNNTSIQYVN